MFKIYDLNSNSTTLKTSMPRSTLGHGSPCMNTRTRNVAMGNIIGIRPSFVPTRQYCFHLYRANKCLGSNTRKPYLVWAKRRTHWIKQACSTLKEGWNWTVADFRVRLNCPLVHHGDQQDVCWPFGSANVWLCTIQYSFMKSHRQIHFQ